MSHRIALEQLHSSRLCLKQRIPMFGFTLVEILMATLILSIATLGTIGLISTSRRQVIRSSEINEINALIEADLANIRSANDRLVCNDGACKLNPTPPSKVEYFPTVVNPESPTSTEKDNIRFFERLCGYLTSSGAFNTNQGFAWALRDLLPSANSTISRSIPDSAIDSTGHRYTVTYRRAGGDSTILRQITLVPTTVAWCPCVPSTIPSSSSDPNLCPLSNP